jgi:hypothetical protein
LLLHRHRPPRRRLLLRTMVDLLAGRSVVVEVVFIKRIRKEKKKETFFYRFIFLGWME